MGKLFNNDMFPYHLLVSKMIAKELCKLGVVLEEYNGSKRNEYITYGGKRYRIPTVEEVSGYLRYEWGIECIVGYNEYDGIYHYEPVVYMYGKKLDYIDKCDDYENAMLECVEYGVFYLVEKEKELDRQLGNSVDGSDV